MKDHLIPTPKAPLIPSLIPNLPVQDKPQLNSFLSPALHPLNLVPGLSELPQTNLPFAPLADKINHERTGS